MNPTEAYQQLLRRIQVTPQRVTIAKAIVLEHAAGDPDALQLISHVLAANQAAIPRPLVLHESVDSLAMICRAAEATSWRVAAIEGIWSLIHSGHLIQLAGEIYPTAAIDWTTNAPGVGSGMSAGWQLEQFVMPVPQRVRVAPSKVNEGREFLSEPDLYLSTLGVPTMHPEVDLAFKEAVRCFRMELFTAALAMLGRASEGAWLELGAALLRALPVARRGNYAKQVQDLESPMVGVQKKILAVLTMYGHREDFEAIERTSGVRLQELRDVSVWSDAVRDSRNTIHFGVSPATPNTYEKLAALLIGAVPGVRTIYRVKNAADAHQAEDAP